jgi:dTDP-glucose 4,6-dehydratase
MPDLGEFDYILNLASESHVDRSIADPVNFIENNVSLTLQVLEYARKHPCKVFLQFSTDEVFGPGGYPSNPYAASKAAQEMTAQAYHRTYGIPLIITNSNNIVGKSQHPEKFVPKVVELIRADKTVPIHMVGGRPGRRWWNPVENIADALIYVLRQGSTGIERYDIPGGKMLDNLEMAQLIAKLMSKPLDYELVEAGAVRPGYDEFYNRAHNIPGWSPVMTLELGLSWIH